MTSQNRHSFPVVTAPKPTRSPNATYLRAGDGTQSTGASLAVAHSAAAHSAAAHSTVIPQVRKSEVVPQARKSEVVPQARKSEAIPPVRKFEELLPVRQAQISSATATFYGGESTAPAVGASPTFTPASKMEEPAQPQEKPDWCKTGRSREDLQRTIEFLQRGLRPSPSISNLRTKSPEQPAGHAAADAPPATKEQRASSVAAVSTTANSTVVHSVAGTRTSSPVSKSGEPKDGLQCALKERQLAELRSQLTSCQGKLYNGSPRAPEGDQHLRLGSPAPSSKSSCHGTYAKTFEGELSWIVRQMEVHRRQIQAHQEQLGYLEKRHAEIVAAVSAKNVDMGGGGTPASSVADQRCDASSAATPTMQQMEESGTRRPPAPEEQSPPLRWGQPTPPRGGGYLHAHSTGGSQCGRREAEHRDAGSPSAASVTSDRTAARPYVSRPGSAVEALQHLRRPPGGVSSPSAGGSPVALGGAHSSAVPAERPFNDQQPPPGGGSVPQTRRQQQQPLSPTRPAHSSPQQQQQPSDSRPQQGAMGVPGSWMSNPRWDAEIDQINRLLRESRARCPTEIQFIPRNCAVEGEGRPYLAGCLEVCLILSEDWQRLMVRVGTGNSGGRVFDIDEFVSRAEAIEARRNVRPNPIAEEAEPSPPPAASNSPPAASQSPVRNGGKPASSLWSRSDKDTSPPVSSTPWKSIFKAHWNSR